MSFRSAVRATARESGKSFTNARRGKHMVAILKGLVRALREANPEDLPAGEFLYRTPAEQLRRLIGV